MNKTVRHTILISIVVAVFATAMLVGRHPISDLNRECINASTLNNTTFHKYFENFVKDEWFDWNVSKIVWTYDSWTCELIVSYKESTETTDMAVVEDSMSWSLEKNHSTLKWTFIAGTYSEILSLSKKK